MNSNELYAHLIQNFKLHAFHLEKREKKDFMLHDALRKSEHMTWTTILSFLLLVCDNMLNCQRDHLEEDDEARIR